MVPLAGWPSALTRNCRRLSVQVSSSMVKTCDSLVRAVSSPDFRRLVASSRPSRWGTETIRGAGIEGLRRRRGDTWQPRMWGPAARISIRDEKRMRRRGDARGLQSLTKPGEQRLDPGGCPSLDRDRSELAAVLRFGDLGGIGRSDVDAPAGADH